MTSNYLDYDSFLFILNEVFKMPDLLNLEYYKDHDVELSLIHI